MIIKTKRRILIYLVYILIIFNGMLILIDAQTYPQIEPYVNDFANILTTEEESLLNIHCESIDLNTTYQIVIVTINSTGGDDELSYANHLGESNGVGQKETDNGVVILWVTDEKTGAIAVGRGAETYLNDAKVGEIGRSSRSMFDNHLYYQGFELIITQIESTIYERDSTIKTSTSETTPAPVKKDNGLLTTFIVILIFGLLIYLILSKSGILPRPDWNFRSGSNGFGGFGGGRSWGGGSFGGGGSRF